MQKPNFKKGWDAFLHWKHWRTVAAFWGRYWNRTLHWSGWKILFGLPFPAILLLSIGCGVGLFWVFANGLENRLPAYFLYPLSAYCLAALCVSLPGALRRGKQWLDDHPRLSGLLRNRELSFTFGLYSEQVINFAYGIFKIVSGVVIGSAWIGCDGIYNLTLSLIQLFQILRRKNAQTLRQQWKSYRFCGVLILLLHLTLTGIVFQMVNWNRAQEQGQIMVIATAFFAFYKITSSFVRIVRDRKHPHPVESSIRMLNLTQAIFAIFSLQATMFHTFGTGEPWEHSMNLMTGCAVCLLIASTGVYMIRRGSRELKKLQENQYGE